jgi:beta-galactosidase
MAAVAMLHAVGAGAQPVGRVERTINDGWHFAYGGQSYGDRFTALVEPGKFRPFERAQVADAGWEQITLPHTWNAKDPFDDVPGYRRGVAWYRRYLTLDSTYAGKSLYLRFEGVNQVADVYVNGAWAGRHAGGYTGFTFDVTKWITLGARNIIAVQVNNAHDPFLAPLAVDFVLYGGIYRDVWLVATDAVHVRPGALGEKGSVVRTPYVSRDSAVVEADVTLANSGRTARTVTVAQMLTDATGREVVRRERVLSLTPGQTSVTGGPLPTLTKPQLWSPDTPYLYTLHTEVRDGERVLDRVTDRVGLRWFAFDSTGFRLNGEKLVLRGTNRHQDHERFGSALSNDLHRRDLTLIKAMGANFLRLAHYPQDPAVLEAADELGLLLWEEIPVVDYINPDARFTAATVLQLREMIRQHRNHPSVVWWGLMNEVLLWSGDGERINRHSDSTYLRQVRELEATLDSVARAEDPSRPTTVALHGSDDYDKAGLGVRTPVVGVNRYDGWYSGVFADLGRGLDKRRAAHPAQSLILSEYGAEDDYRVNSLVPERFDFSGTWQRRYHESYLRQLAARPWLAGSAVWNQFDFGKGEIGGSIPFRNQKGLMTWNREYKDVYFLYQANWTRTPMVHIASRTWTRRTGTDSTAPAGAGMRAVRQPVDVYSNAAKVELFLNGRSLGVRVPDDVKRITWEVPFTDGPNVLEARTVGAAAVATDRLVIDFTYRAPRLADASVPFRDLGVNVGSQAEMADVDGVLWVADRVYTPGGYGHVGGEPMPFSKELPVRGTSQPPVYITYREGLQGYRFDVPDGEYEVELRFAEPNATPIGERVFDVVVNGVLTVSRLDLAAQAGTGVAVPILSTARATDGRGIDVRFMAHKGKPLLSAIRVRRK